MIEVKKLIERWAFILRVNMNDLITAVATIQGAQIQANYTLWAALLSSLIGALGIVIAAWYAFKSGLETQVKNHLLESRRSIYLDFITRSSDLVNCGGLIQVHPETFYEELYKIGNAFDSSIQQVLLIAETKNQEKIYNFYGVCNSAFSSYIDAVNKYRSLESNKEKFENIYYQIIQALKSFNEAIEENDTISNNDFKILESINENFRSLKKFHEESTETKEKLKQLSDDLIFNTKVAASEVAIALRNELGISTDISLEMTYSHNFLKK